MIGEPSLEQLASLAVAGDRVALNTLLSEVQHPMYRLSLRFLGHPSDAQDATQEILLRITTHLSTFEGRSSFNTWAYTIATRMLMRTRKRAVETSVLSADRFAEILDAGLAGEDFTAEAVEYRELTEEVRIRCTYGMLLCLSRPMRAAYLLGDVLGFSDTEGAEIFAITPAAFRQRLARSRRVMRSIIEGRCGLIDSANPCRCTKQIGASINSGIMRRDDKTFSRHPYEFETGPFETAEFQKAADHLDSIVAIGSLYQRDRFAAPADVWQRLRNAMPELIDVDLPPNRRKR